MERRETRLAYSTGGDQEPEEDQPPPPSKGRLSVRIEKRPSNRVATLVQNLPGGKDEARALARELKTALGAGGSLKDGILELQGDHKARVEAWLKARLKAPREKR
jgi:translation initiation factor 1